MPECKEKKKSRVFKIFRLYHSSVGDTNVQSLYILVSSYKQNLWSIRDDKHYLGTSYNLLSREEGGGSSISLWSPLIGSFKIGSQFLQSPPFNLCRRRLIPPPFPLKFMWSSKILHPPPPWLMIVDAWEEVKIKLDIQFFSLQTFRFRSQMLNQLEHREIQRLYALH